MITITVCKYRAIQLIKFFAEFGMAISAGPITGTKMYISKPWLQNLILYLPA